MLTLIRIHDNIILDDTKAYQITKGWCLIMKLTLAEVKRMRFVNGTIGWVLGNGTKVAAFENDNFTGTKHDIVEGGTLEYVYGKGFVVNMNNESILLKDFIATADVEIKSEEVAVKELSDSSIKVGDLVNVAGEILKVSSDGEVVNDDDYGRMFKRIIRYENSSTYTFGTTIYK